MGVKKLIDSRCHVWHYSTPRHFLIGILPSLIGFFEMLSSFKDGDRVQQYSAEKDIQSIGNLE